MGCGVPVIGTSGTGLIELVDHDVDGFLFPIGDTTHMAAAAISLLADEPRLKEFKRRATEKAHHDFNADAIVDHYERYYRQILEGRNAAGGACRRRAPG